MNRFAVLGLAIVVSASAAPAAAPTVYYLCGIGAEGAPTQEQLMCVAQAVGVPADPAQRVVLRGHDATFDEPVFEVRYPLERTAADGTEISWTMTLDLSEVDGQILYYGFNHEPMPPGPGVDATASRTVALSDLCRAGGAREPSPDRLRCIARALGLADGLHGLKIMNRPGGAREATWTVETTLEAATCISSGMVVEIARTDARILRYGLTQGGCAHAPKPARPSWRTRP